MKSKNETNLYGIYFNSIIPYILLISKYLFKIFCCSYFCVMRASRLPVPFWMWSNCIQYPYSLYLMPRHRVFCYRRFGINLHTHLHLAKYY